MINTGEIPQLAAKTIIRKVKSSKEYEAFVQKASGNNIGLAGITGSGLLGSQDGSTETEKKDECIQM